MRLRNKTTGADVDDAETLADALVVCHVVRGRLATDAQLDELNQFRSALGGPDADPSAAARLEDAAAARQATWRALPPGHGADSALDQAAVARLDVRLRALDSLVASVDASPGFDDAMVAKLRDALSTVCDGLDPAVAAAVDRIKAHVDERAELLAARDG